jgi:hypothetical protein
MSPPLTKQTVLEMIRGLPEEWTWSQIKAQLDQQLLKAEHPGEEISEAEATASWNAEIKERLAGLREGRAQKRPVTELFPELSEASP